MVSRKPNFTQIGQEMRKVRVKIHLRPCVEYGCP